MQQSLFTLLNNHTDDASIQTVTTWPITNVTFTVVDIETTGLNAKKNAITELTAIQFKPMGRDGGYEEVKRLSSLVKPTESIPPDVERITGITDAMVADAPSVRDVLQQFCDLIGPDPVIVGHNVGFDIGFIREKLNQAGLEYALPRVNVNRGVCTRNLARKVLPGLPSYEGVVVATACDVVNDNPHRAEADVRMSAGILFSLLTRLPEVKTVQEIITLQGPLKS